MDKKQQFRTEFLTLCDEYGIDASEMSIEFLNKVYDIAIPLGAEVKTDACGFTLPMIITIKKDEIGNRTYYGQSTMIDSLFKYLRKKKIPFIEPRNKEGLYDKIQISLSTPEQALNLLLWDKFELLSKRSF